eukprot:SAG22_NODE_465_length_10181_cov_6.604444_9_plen_79_part_00
MSSFSPSEDRRCLIIASSSGAKLGVLIKGGRALEVGAKITTVCFDKTVSSKALSSVVLPQELCVRQGLSIPPVCHRAR